MTPDEYVAGVLSKYAVARGASSPAELLGGRLAGPLRQWAGNWLAGLSYSGSYAKGTGVNGVTDVDLFISLNSGTPGSLVEIYEGLFAVAEKQGWQPRRQDVSIGVKNGGAAADLVPGRIQEGYTNYHSLYRRKTGGWTRVVRHGLGTRGRDSRGEDLALAPPARMVLVLPGAVRDSGAQGQATRCACFKCHRGALRNRHFPWNDGHHRPREHE
jgi:hypothetical protein